MKALFDKVSEACSLLTTRTYSNSFSIGVRCLDKRIRWAIYAIYGFVRFADEIVDSFHDFDKPTLFYEFQSDTWKAIDRKISMNPILNSFQKAVHLYGIDRSLIERFLKSMETDLNEQMHSADSYEEYIVGSAEVVGLMCLRVFTENDDELYNQLKLPASRLGAAFQKVNFLRDIKADHEELGRMYFPGIDFDSFTASEKKRIEEDIERDFYDAYSGLIRLNANCRFGVFVAFSYYKALLGKIQRLSPDQVQQQRIRISGSGKIVLLIAAFLRHKFLMRGRYAA